MTSRHYRKGVFTLLATVVALLPGCAKSGMDIVRLADAEKPRQDNIRFALSPDGKQICFTAKGKGSSDLYLLDLATKKVRAVTRSPEFETTPTFTPDGKHLVFAAAPNVKAAAALFVCALDGTSRRQITHPAGAFDYSPCFYAKGARLAFARASLHRPYSMGGMTWDNWDVYTVALNGSDLRRLTNAQFIRLYNVTASEHSSEVVFDADDTSKNCIYKVPSSGTSAQKPLTDGPRDSEPSFAADGSFLVYTSDVSTPFDYDLWRMKPDGTDKRQLTHAKSDLSNPHLSPDGTTLFYLSDHEHQIRYALYAANADGSSPRLIADSSLFDDPLHWKP